MALLKIIKNTVVNSTMQYALVSYSSFALSFINTFLLAKYFSIFDFGIYGFITLCLQYLAYSNFGISYSYVNNLSIRKHNKELASVINSNVFILNSIFSLVLVLLGGLTLILFPDFLGKYNYSEHSFYIIAIAIIINFNVLYIKLYRVFLNIYKLMYQLLITPLSLFLMILFLGESVQVKDVLIVILLSRFSAFLLFLNSMPLKVEFKINIKLVKILIVKGVRLLFYNASLGFIALSAITLVSVLFCVEDFSQFKLAFTISGMATLIAASFETLIYPKILNKVTYIKSNDLLKFIDYSNSIYVSIVNLLNFSILCALPLLVYIFPKYVPMLDSLKLFIVANILMSYAYVYKVILISRKDEILLAIYALSSIVLIVALSLFFSMLSLPFSYVALSFILGTILFVLLTMKRSIFYLKNEELYSIIKKNFNLRIVIPILFILFSALYHDNLYSLFLAFGTYILINVKSLDRIIKAFKRLIGEKSLLDF
ncbi:MAG: hypothetical protein JXR82_14440 [Marinifilaceae bacterium]|nr:hypothetical protein [Marinifilaceae bacterium]